MADSKRIATIDWMRCLVMVLMIVDHASMAFDGQGRIVLGLDDGIAEIDQLLARNDLSAADKEAVLGGNARRFSPDPDTREHVGAVAVVERPEGGLVPGPRIVHERRPELRRELHRSVEHGIQMPPFRTAPATHKTLCAWDRRSCSTSSRARPAAATFST